MKKRTTSLDVLKLAWRLWRSPHRTNMRIGQLLENAANRRTHHDGASSVPLFYMENKPLRRAVKDYSL